MTTTLTRFCLALLLAMSLPALAQEATDDIEGSVQESTDTIEAPTAPMTTREQVETQLADLKDRLNLTDYQWTQVEMILKSSIRERVAIAKRYGLDGGAEALANLERKDKRAIRKQMKDSRKFTEQRMKRYLDKDQMKEFKAVQEEIHEQILNRLEAQT